MKFYGESEKPLDKKEKVKYNLSEDKEEELSALTRRRFGRAVFKRCDFPLGVSFCAESSLRIF